MNRIFYGIAVALALTGTAAAKPVNLVQDQRSVPEIQNEETIRSAMACHVLENLPAHTRFIEEAVIPRISDELPDLIRAHTNSDGDTFYMAEAIDYGDLFHTHTNVPMEMLEIGENKASPDGLSWNFTNPERYHLQYHSFENLGHLVQKWTGELSRTMDERIASWLEKLKELERLHSYSGSYSYQDTSELSRQASLSDEQLREFADVWHHSQGSNSPGIEQLQKRLKQLDPLGFLHANDLLSYRSIRSDEKSYTPIRRLHTKGYWSPTTVFFEEIDDSPAVRTVIEKARSAGLSRIVDPTSPYIRDYLKDHPELDFDRETHSILSEELRQAALNEPNDNYALKHILGGENSVLITTWDDHYIFSIAYHLPCESPGEKHPRELVP